MRLVKHLLQTALILMLLLTTPFAGSRSPQQWPGNVFPIDAAVIGRIDLNRALSAPIGAKLLTGQKTRYSTINWWLEAAFGINLEQVDMIWFVGDDKEGGIVVLHGNFDAATVATKIKRVPGWNSERHRGIPQVSAFIGDDGKPQLAAVLQDRLLALGDQEMMKNVLLVWRGKQAALDPAVVSVQRVLASPAQLAATVLDVSVLSENEDSPFTPLQGAWLEGNLGQDLTLTLELEAIDEKVAQGIQHMLAGFLIIAERHPDVMGEPANLDAVQNAELKRTGRKLELKLMLLGDLLIQTDNNK